MAIEFKKQDYMSSKQILAFPDHYVAITQLIEKNSALGTVVEGRKIVKAGTVFPSNDAKAIGIVMNDYDVTDGDVNAAIIIHGFVRADKLPAPVNELALPVLKQITVLPANKAE